MTSSTIRIWHRGLFANGIVDYSNMASSIIRIWHRRLFEYGIVDYLNVCNNHNINYRNAYERYIARTIGRAHPN